ncbi:hypothetical protein OH77DRAFT_295117 [Trametes cingulata]|nr:hypothetical protein OH77DRAFT_295117 [Trametes cingulata]
MFGERWSLVFSPPLFRVGSSDIHLARLVCPPPAFVPLRVFLSPCESRIARRDAFESLSRTGAPSIAPPRVFSVAFFCRVIPGPFGRRKNGSNGIRSTAARCNRKPSEPFGRRFRDSPTRLGNPGSRHMTFSDAARVRSCRKTTQFVIARPQRETRTSEALYQKKTKQTQRVHLIAMIPVPNRPMRSRRSDTRHGVRLAAGLPPQDADACAFSARPSRIIRGRDDAWWFPGAEPCTSHLASQRRFGHTPVSARSRTAESLDSIESYITVYVMRESFGRDDIQAGTDAVRVRCDARTLVRP